MDQRSTSSRDSPAVVAVPPAEMGPVCPAEWQGCSPNVVLDLLRKLSPPKLGANKNEFYSSYPATWQKLNGVQANKALQWFLRLTVQVQEELLASARNTTEDNTAVEKERAEATHKNDLVRLLELYAWVDAQILWDRTREPMDRATLDARNSDSAMNATGTATMADDADPYSALAVHFNDYTGFAMQNRVLKHHFVNGHSVPVTPAVAVDPEQTTLAHKCFDLNPTDMTRASILRDGAWLKSRWLSLRTDLSNLFADFNRSGYHTAFDEAEVKWMCPEMFQSWISFCSSKNRHFPQVLVYAYAVLDKVSLESLGKQMEEGMGRDCSLGGKNAARSAVYDGGKKRKKIQERAKEMRKQRRGGNSSSLAQVIERATVKEHDISILEILTKAGDKRTAKMAVARLTAMLSSQPPARKGSDESDDEEEDREEEDEELSETNHYGYSDSD